MPRPRHHGRNFTPPRTSDFKVSFTPNFLMDLIENWYRHATTQSLPESTSISTHRTLRALSTASLTTLHANTEPRTFKFKSELIGHLLLDLHETRWTCSAHRGWSASTVVFDWTNPKRAVVTAKVRQCSPTFCKSWEPIPVFSAITSKRLGSHFYKCWSCGHLYKGWHWSHLNKCWQCSHLYKEWRQSLLYKCWLCSHLYKCWSRSHLYK